MKKYIKEVDEKKGIVQVTIADERWYMKPSKVENSGIPTYIGVPSVTWIAGFYPKGIAFYKWLAEKGWDESQAIKNAAGDKGSKVHLAITDVIEGKEVRIDSKYINKSRENEEELAIDECDAILSFIAWKKEVNPISVAWDLTIFSEQHNFAGTIDYICIIDEQLWIIDFKTSANVWKEYELQISAYKKAVENGENPIIFNGKQLDVSNIKLGILQVGYKRNKAGYKFNEIENKFDLFLTAQKIWKEEVGNQDISKKDYPIILSPAMKASDVIFENSDTVDVTEVDETTFLPIKKIKKHENI